MKTRLSILLSLFCLAELGCQAVIGIDDLHVISSSQGGGGGSGGSAGGEGGGGISGAGGFGGGSVGMGGAPIMGTIHCGAVDCPVGPESACCHDEYNMPAGATSQCVVGPPATDNCNTSAGVDGFESRIECQLPSHCPMGSLCCASQSTAAGYTWFPTVVCQSSCDWPSRIVCDPDALPDICPLVTYNGMMVQLSCQPSQYLPPSTYLCLPP